MGAVQAACGRGEGECTGLWGRKGIIRPQFWLNMTSHRLVFALNVRTLSV